MPGAVTFVDGSVQAVNVERARLVDAIPEVSVPIPLAGVEVAARAWQAPRATLVRPAVRRIIPFR